MCGVFGFNTPGQTLGGGCGGEGCLDRPEAAAVDGGKKKTKTVQNEKKSEKVEPKAHKRIPIKSGRRREGVERGWDSGDRSSESVAIREDTGVFDGGVCSTDKHTHIFTQICL